MLFSVATWDKWEGKTVTFVTMLNPRLRGGLPEGSLLSPS
jgi:hypothetical protein